MHKMIKLLVLTHMNKTSKIKLLQKQYNESEKKLAEVVKGELLDEMKTKLKNSL